MDNSKVYAMKLTKIYPLLTAKAEKKGRTRQEVNEVICWLTGYDEAGLQSQLNRDVSYGEFFANAPHIHENAPLITGSVCGVKVEQIEDPLMQNIRRLDKLVDELAKGWPMSRILRR